MEIIRRERDTISANDEEASPSRLVTIPAKRLYGEKKQLLGSVAEAATRELGKPVSVRQVRKVVSDDL